MIGFCLGIGGKDDAERAQRRSSLTEQVREIMKHILDARSVLSEVPPTTPTMAPVGFNCSTKPLTFQDYERDLCRGNVNYLSVRKSITVFFDDH